MPTTDQLNIDRIAALVRLSPTPEETSTLECELEAMLQMLTALPRQEPDEMPAEAVPLEGLRADEAVNGEMQKALLAAAPETAEGYICVPRAVNGGDA